MIPSVDFRVAPMVDALASQPDNKIGGARPPTSPGEYTQGYDWDAFENQEETRTGARSTARGERNGRSSRSQSVSCGPEPAR